MPMPCMAGENNPPGCGFVARTLSVYAHGLNLGVKHRCRRVKRSRREPRSLTQAAGAIALLCPCSTRRDAGRLGVTQRPRQGAHCKQLPPSRRAERCAYLPRAREDKEPLGR